MPTQLMAVSNNPRSRRNQIAELNARQSMLPQIIENKQRAEDLVRADELNKIQQGQFNRQHTLAQNQFSEQQRQFKKTRKAQKRQGQVQMGLEAGKLGLGIASQYGGRTLGKVGGDFTNLFSSSGTPSTPATFGGGTFGNALSNISLGNLVGGGLAGYGLSSMIGGKNKVKKAAIGAGAGALLGLLGGGSGGNSWGDALSGGFGGMLGGLFG